MFSYYFHSGVRSLRRNAALTALIVLILAIGIAACVSTITIVHAMSGDPIPQKSGRLFVPVLDNGPLNGYNRADTGRRDPGDLQMTYIDAVNLLKQGFAERRAAMYGISTPIEPARRDMPVIAAQAIATTRDFFAMFDAPFIYGQAWGAVEDQAGADVIVLSRAMAERLFGAVDPVGRRLRIHGQDFQIVGVLGDFTPRPKFYRLVGGPGAFAREEDVMMPFATAVRHEYGVNGTMSCLGARQAGWQGLLDSGCTWIQFFFETRNSAQRGQLQTQLDNYTDDQRKLGRFPRHAPNELYDVVQWLRYLKVVDNDSRLAAWLAGGFLALCLVNTMGLLLAKFSARAYEVGIRRALGASRREIFQQFLTETAVMGAAGAVLGLLLSWCALAIVASRSPQMLVLAHMDWTMLAFTVVLAVLSSLLAGLLPSWRACQVTPAIQLKSQ